MSRCLGLAFALLGTVSVWRAIEITSAYLRPLNDTLAPLDEVATRNFFGLAPDLYDELLRQGRTREAALLDLSPLLFELKRRETFGLWRLPWRTRWLCWRARRWIRPGREPKAAREAGMRENAGRKL